MRQIVTLSLEIPVPWSATPARVEAKGLCAVALVIGALVVLALSLA